MDVLLHTYIKKQILVRDFGILWTNPCALFNILLSKNIRKYVQEEHKSTKIAIENSILLVVPPIHLLFDIIINYISRIIIRYINMLQSEYKHFKVGIQF